MYFTCVLWKGEHFWVLPGEKVLGRAQEGWWRGDSQGWLRSRGFQKSLESGGGGARDGQWWGWVWFQAPAGIRRWVSESEGSPMSNTRGVCRGPSTCNSADGFTLSVVCVSVWTKEQKSIGAGDLGLQGLPSKGGRGEWCSYLVLLQSKIFSYLTEQRSWHKQLLLLSPRQLEMTGAEGCGGSWLPMLRCPETLEMPWGNWPGLWLLAQTGEGVPQDPTADQPAPLDVLQTSGHLKWPGMPLLTRLSHTWVSAGCNQSLDTQHAWTNLHRGVWLCTWSPPHVSVQPPKRFVLRERWDPVGSCTAPELRSSGSSWDLCKWDSSYESFAPWSALFMHTHRTSNWSLTVTLL